MMTDRQRFSISVLIPAYNAAYYLEECLESIFQQTFTPTEIILVDDASTDATAKIAAQYSQVKLISSNQHVGVSAARNLCLAHCNGYYIAFQDADDIWKRTKLEIQLEQILEKEVEVVFCRMENFIDPKLAVDYQQYWAYHPALKLKQLGLQSALIVRTAFEKIGYFSTDLTIGEDLDWFARAEQAGYTKFISEEVLVHRRLHQNNLTRQTPADKKSTMFKIIKKITAQSKGRIPE